MKKKLFHPPIRGKSKWQKNHFSQVSKLKCCRNISSNPFQLPPNPRSWKTFRIQRESKVYLSAAFKFINKESNFYPRINNRRATFFTFIRSGFVSNGFCLCKVLLKRRKNENNKSNDWISRFSWKICKFALNVDCKRHYRRTQEYFPVNADEGQSMECKEVDSEQSRTNLLFSSIKEICIIIFHPLRTFEKQSH